MKRTIRKKRKSNKDLAKKFQEMADGLSGLHKCVALVFDNPPFKPTSTILDTIEIGVND